MISRYLAPLSVLVALFMAAPAQAADTPFGPREQGLYQIAVAHWDALPPAGCMYVEARVTTDLDPGKVGLFWRDGNTCKIRVLASITADPVLTCLVVTHEVGHMRGLDHSSDPHDVMYPTYSLDELPSVPICGQAATLPAVTIPAPDWVGRASALEGEEANLTARCGRGQRYRRCWRRVRARRAALRAEWAALEADAVLHPAFV